MRLGPVVLVSLVAACGTPSGRAPEPAGDGGAGPSGGGEGGATLGDPVAGGGGLANDSGAPQGGADQAGGGFDGGAGTGACDPEAAFDPLAASRVHGLQLHRLSVSQAVDVPIMELGQELLERKTKLVSGRAGLLRAFLKPAAGWIPRLVLARLSLTTPTLDAPQVLEKKRLIEGASTDAQLTSTFNFVIPAELMSATAS